MKLFLMLPILCCGLILQASLTPVYSQDAGLPETQPSSATETESKSKPAVEKMADTVKETTAQAVETVKETTAQAAEIVTEKTAEIRKQVDASPEAKKYSAGILQPIYALAEYMSFSSFHWVAFFLMISGVVSFALQLVLGKLAVLVRGGLSLAEILTDVQGLLISLVGLFLTTQAATENSDFTGSAGAVLSATVLGLILGFLFYLWGQSTELQALRGRKEEAKASK